MIRTIALAAATLLVLGSIGSARAESAAASPDIMGLPVTKLPAPAAQTVHVAEARHTRKMSDLPDGLLLTRKRILTDKSVAYHDLQALADYGDALGAFMLGKRLEDMADPDLLDDAAHYFAVAASNGQGAAVRPLVRLLDSAGGTFQPSLLTQAQQALEVQARAQQELAVSALIRYYTQGNLYPKDLPRAQALLKNSAAKGNNQAAFDVAMELLSGTPDDTARTDAVRFLKIAALSDELNMRFMAENLLRTLQPQTLPQSKPVTP